MKTSHSHRMGRVPALVCLTILALLAQGCTRDPNVRKVKYLNSGKAYAAQGKEKEAIIQFSNAVKIDPHFAAAHFELAKAYLKSGSAMGAYTELRRTVDLDPKNVEARLTLAQIYLAARQYPKSLEQANAILVIDPKNADAWAVKSGIATANNDHEEALKDIQQALAYAPNRAGFHAQLGLIQASDPSTAKDAEGNVREAVKLDPKNAPAHLLLSAMLQKKGDDAGAVAEAQAATQADPKNARAWLTLAALYYKSGDKAKSEATLMQATDELHDTNDGANLLFNYYRQTGQMDRAATVYEQLSNKYPKSVPIKMTYAQILIDQGNFAKVQQIVDELNKTNPNEPQVQAMTGMLLLHNGKTDDAYNLLQKAAKNSPDNIALKYWLGTAAKAKGDLAGAEENFRAVTQAQPGNLPALRELAALAAAKKDNAQLQQIAETLITRFPNLSDGYLWRAVAEVNLGRTDQADADLQTAIKKNPKDSASLVALGELRMKQKRYPEAVTLLQQSLDANPNQLPALQMLVGYYMFQKQPDKATALVQQEIAKTPNNGALYVDAVDHPACTEGRQRRDEFSREGHTVEPVRPCHDDGLYTCRDCFRERRRCYIEVAGVDERASEQRTRRCDPRHAGRVAGQRECCDGLLQEGARYSARQSRRAEQPRISDARERTGCGYGAVDGGIGAAYDAALAEHCGHACLGLLSQGHLRLGA